MNSYNLLDEKWIPVLYHNGTVERVGILKALEDADRIRQIAASNPMDRLAILRFLLAVLYWCKGNPPADMNANDIDSFPSEWFAKLDESKESFNLLGAKGGFYQDHETKGIVVSVTNLLHDLPSATNIAHFRHIRDERDGMCLPCCALGILRWSTAAPAGTAGAGQSMTASINGVTPTYSIPTGATLLTTLLLTWPGAHAVQNDAPVWAGANEESPLGFLKGMTWRSRCIFLAPPDAKGKRGLSSGHCCHCGEQTDRLVKSILFRPGWKRPSKEPWSDDPHLLRITRKDGKSAKAKEKKIVPSWPSPNDPLEDHAGVWRSVMEGLLQRSAGLQICATEFHTTLLGTSQALYKHVGEHRAALPDLASDVAQRLSVELEWLREVTWVTIAARGGNWRDPPKGHRIVGALCAPRAKGQAIRSSLCARSFPVERELEQAFQRLVQDLATAGEVDGEAIVRNWRARAGRVLCSYAGQSVDAAKSGSPLRQREAKRCADDAILEAVRETDRKKGVSK
ncbi:MAG: type I-E CRISPR-associated protein Cse1/CasA [Armatimonadota bacterium]|nr:type I-E CRISPR-associated protein Cse1/CasA [Armatimonadota bacterium]